MNKNKLCLLFTLLPLTLTSCSDKTDYLKISLKEDNATSAKFLDASKAESFQEVYKNTNFTFSFKEETDVFEIHDLRNNYDWKTGIDAPLADLEAYYNLSRTERKEFAANFPSIEGDMTTNYIALANSFVTLEIFSQSDRNYRSTYFPSGLNSGIVSNLEKVAGEDNHFKFVVDYSGYTVQPVDVQVTVDIFFTEDGYDIKIYDCNITGANKNMIKSIIVTPFLGSTGGVKYFYDEEARDYDAVATENPIEPGYALIPDGPGSLIPFTNNSVADLTAYRGNVYGEDPSAKTGNNTVCNGLMSIKNATYPVYGVSFTEQNAAFVCYADEGEEYMMVNYGPDNSGKMQYNRVYPSFTYNYEFNQIYNSAGDFYATIATEKNSYDSSLHYSFLANDKANYVGMAETYRNHLIDTNKIQIRNENNTNIPLRLDFIMSDTKSSIVGNSNVVVTSANEVKNILNDIKYTYSIDNVVSSLQGWQKSGKSTQNPGKAKFSSKVGTAKQFKKLFKEMDDNNYDVSFYENYSLVNQEQVTYLNNASKHKNGYYDKYINFDLNFESFYAFAKANKSYDYVVSQNKALSKKVGINSMTVDGISSYLVSHEDTLSRTVAKQYLSNAFKYLDDQDLTINAIAPNSYLYQYVDRYFDFDVYDSSLLIERETIPFLSLVLNGTMEIYSTYCNFSFYDNSAICKMVDYNISPSFILTNDSSYSLNSTNSCVYYSTQYSEYKDLINNVYGKVNSVLKEVSNAAWTNRTQVASDVYKNTYSNGKEVIINYSGADYVYNGKTIKAESCEVM